MLSCIHCSFYGYLLELLSLKNYFGKGNTGRRVRVKGRETESLSARQILFQGLIAALKSTWRQVKEGGIPNPGAELTVTHKISIADGA